MRERRPQVLSEGAQRAVFSQRSQHGNGGEDRQPSQHGNCGEGRQPSQHSNCGEGRQPSQHGNCGEDRQPSRKSLRGTSMGSEPCWWLLLCLTFFGAAGTDPPTAPMTAERRWQPTDIVLDCFLVTEDRHRGAFASSGGRERALLVLKQVPVLDDGSLEGITDFQGSTETKHDSPIIFEASVDLVQIPQAEALLHADCSGKAVTCEISQYFLQARQETTSEKAHWFISNVQVSRGGPSVSMVMKILRDAEAGAVWHPMLNLPLSPQGIVKTKVEFQVTSETQTLNHLLGSSVSLHCSFSMAPGLDLTGVEWRLQHKGSGQLVYSWKTGQGQAKRKGATLEPAELLMAGNASLTLSNLTLKDEGNYICQVSTSLYQAQQITPLNILATPKVQLNLANKDPLPSLVCSIAGYYPLDVVVTWIREELGEIPAQVSGASFSSLRQSMMGTYSISSTVIAEPGPTGATYICQVAHVSLEEPLTVSMKVLPNTEQSGALGVIFASIIFLFTLLFLGLRRQQASLSRSTRNMRHSG